MITKYKCLSQWSVRPSDPFCFNGSSSMQENEDGEWVKFDDLGGIFEMYENKIQELEDQIPAKQLLKIEERILSALDKSQKDIDDLKRGQKNALRRHR